MTTVAIDSPDRFGPATTEGTEIERTVPLHFELHTDETVPERTALATLVDAVLPALQTTGVLETRSCYFDRLMVAKQDRLRLSFADGDASAEVMALLAARFDAQGRPRPYRVIHSPGSMLADLVAGPMAAEVFERFSRRSAPLIFGWIEEIAAGNRKLPSIRAHPIGRGLLSRALSSRTGRTPTGFSSWPGNPMSRAPQWKRAMRKSPPVRRPAFVRCSKPSMPTRWRPTSHDGVP
jgi:hypothetical protein